MVVILQGIAGLGWVLRSRAGSGDMYQASDALHEHSFELRVRVSPLNRTVKYSEALNLTITRSLKFTS